MHTCYLGVDDGYFDVSLKRYSIRFKTVLVGVLLCNSRLEDVFLDLITIDGLDATLAAYRIINKAKDQYILGAVFLDGITYAGFNIVDPQKLYTLSSVPIIVIFRHRLDLSKIEAALKKHFHDYRYRFRVIENAYNRSLELMLEHIPTVVRIYSVGISIVRVKRLFQELCSVFADPYPLWAADKIASILGRILAKKLVRPNAREGIGTNNLGIG